MLEAQEVGEIMKKILKKVLTKNILYYIMPITNEQ
nr:MAG TPA: hypothetical protein [Caudoviricetes sp.]